MGTRKDHIMGWDYTKGATKANIVKALIAPQPRHQAKEYRPGTQGSQFVPCDYEIERQTLKYAVKGKTLWTVEETVKSRGGKPFETARVIGCYELGVEKGFGWGHKAMCEAMLPYVYSCPLEYLDMVPAACEKWRVRVRAWHAAEARELKQGRVYALIECAVPRVEITSLKPLRGLGSDGKLYRLTKQLIGDEVPE